MNDDQNVQNEPSSQPQRPLTARLTLAFVALAAVASIGYVAAKFTQQPGPMGLAGAETDPEELAKRAPVADFILTDAEGKQKKLSELKGQVVILSFWASWCGPCLVELPTFGELSRKYGEHGLQILAVNVDEGNDGRIFAKDFWQKHQFPFPSYFDTNKTLAQQFEVDMLPSNFVLDRQGRMVFSGFGANDWTSSENIEFIEGLLQESPQDPI